MADVQPSTFESAPASMRAIAAAGIAMCRLISSASALQTHNHSALVPLALNERMRFPCTRASKACQFAYRSREVRLPETDVSVLTRPYSLQPRELAAASVADAGFEALSESILHTDVTHQLWF